MKHSSLSRIQAIINAVLAVAMLVLFVLQVMMMNGVDTSMSLIGMVLSGVGAVGFGVVAFFSYLSGNLQRARDE